MRKEGNQRITSTFTGMDRAFRCFFFPFINTYYLRKKHHKNFLQVFQGILYLNCYNKTMDIADLAMIWKRYKFENSRNALTGNSFAVGIVYEKEERRRNVMTNEKSKDIFLETAIQFARMYGVAETLHPIRYLEEEAFSALILQWTRSYLESEGNDLVAFFEHQIKEWPKNV